MSATSVPLPVIVGVDGSAAALRAARWAADEAIARGVPLQLIYAVDPESGDGADTAGRSAAEVALRAAHAAVAATGSPVAISDQIVTGDPKTELIRASRSATLLCVGALGRGHFTHGHVGSTAEALASAAHCPVIIIRDNTKSPAAQDGWVIAVADESLESSNVVELGVSEALIRHAPLRIVQALATTGEAAATGGDRQARNRLDRYVAHWAHRHPELRVDTEVVHGQILDILTRLADNIRLVVVGAHDVATHRDLFGAGGYAALRDSDCPLLVANRRRTL